MKYIIYEIFSGVGLCNQLFSLETSVYLANVLNRKLILIIKNPLAHCGKASWNYGYLLNFFNPGFMDTKIQRTETGQVRSFSQQLQ